MRICLGLCDPTGKIGKSAFVTFGVTLPMYQLKKKHWPSRASGAVAAAGVLDIAGGRGEVAFELHHVHKIPVVLLEPRLWSPYKLSRRQRAILKKDSINIDTFSIPQLQCTLDAQSWEQHRQVCSHTISVDISLGYTERLE